VLARLTDVPVVISVLPVAFSSNSTSTPDCNSISMFVPSVLTFTSSSSLSSVNLVCLPAPPLLRRQKTGEDLSKAGGYSPSVRCEASRVQTPRCGFHQAPSLL
jgi:hypothetical protein